MFSVLGGRNISIRKNKIKINSISHCPILVLLSPELVISLAEFCCFIGVPDHPCCNCAARTFPDVRYLCCLMEQREAAMNKTQPGGRNLTCWKVFTRIVHRNVAHNDESEAPEQSFLVSFIFYCSAEIQQYAMEGSFCFTEK